MTLSYLLAKIIRNYLIPKAIRGGKIDRRARVCSGAALSNVTLGAYSYIGHDCTVNDCTIGKFCSIANDCLIGGSEHPWRWISTSPVFQAERNVLGKNFSEAHFTARKQTEIGNDVWLGARVVVKSGVKIGNGAVIGVGSIVTKNVPDFEIWAGNPAHFIRKRFDEETETAVRRAAWWDWDEETLRRYGNTFRDPAAFSKMLSEQTEE